MMSTVFDFSAQRLSGEIQSLADYSGQVLLIVNTASRCGFTPQYKGLQALHERYAGQGFAVLGFPCNQFGGQEPGDSAEIAAFCDTRFAIRFPLFEKIQVNGAGAHPLYQHLTQAAPGVLGTRRIKWNFTKFLVGRDGAVIRRFAPTDKPEALVAEIERALAESS